MMEVNLLLRLESKFEKVFNISNEGALYCEIKGGLNLFFEPFDMNKFGNTNRFGGSSVLLS